MKVVVEEKKKKKILKILMKDPKLIKKNKA
jgi:hypothetical protein